MKRTGGFTLIELMVVVGLMILVGSIVVSGSFGMTRASGYSAAQNLVYNTLQMARQKACVDGKRVIIAFGGTEENDKDAESAFTAIEASGIITEEVTGTAIGDRCAHLGTHSEYSGENVDDSDFFRPSVWNLRTGGKVTGIKIVTTGAKTEIKSLENNLYIPGTKDGYGYSITRIETTTDSKGKFTGWRRGDAYGFQIVPLQFMPKGFKIGFGGVKKNPKGNLIVFEPDGTSFSGTSATTGIRKDSTNVELYLYEEISAKDANKAIKIQIRNGIISVKK